ncbi:integron [Sinorhizobium meliloti]|uniref:integron n=1 Tax=Rhizobium meliloti TaxID=382 RepID=UPI003D6511D9
MKIRKSSAMFAAIAVISATTASWSQEPGRRPQVPVVIEADPNIDACGGNGVVGGLNPSGDGFLAVRSGPAPKYAEIDRLYNGEEVYLCAVRGKWLGVVYSNQRQHCNVTKPWISTQPYTGPCKSGWIHQNWVSLYAG